MCNVKFSKISAIVNSFFSKFHRKLDFWEFPPALMGGGDLSAVAAK
jgi:hypothetical protein